MMRTLIVSCFIIFIYGCVSNSTNNNNESSTAQNIDSTSENEEAIDYKELRMELIKNYSKKYLIDTAFDGDIKVVAEYYCLFDSTVIIPQEYIWEGGMQRFITHNYKTNLRIYKKGDMIFCDTIAKQNFSCVNDSTLNNYGILMSPTVKFDSSKVELQYSFSIPVTDIGQAVKMVYNLKDGKKVAKCGY